MPPVGNNLIKRSFNETDSGALGLRVGLAVGLIRGLYVLLGLGGGVGFGEGVAVGRGINSGKIGFITFGLGAGGLTARGFTFAFGPLPFLPSIIIWPSWV